MLTHLSTHHVSKPLLLLAISEEGFQVDTLDEPVQIVFILLSPTHLSFQRKLLILNRLGRLIGGEKTKKKLAKAKNIDEIRKTLSAKLTILPGKESEEETAGDS